MTLYDAMQKTEPGRLACWISDLLYDCETALKKIGEQMPHTKIAQDIPAGMRRLRAYVEALAMAELKKEVDRDFGWVRQVIEHAKALDAGGEEDGGRG